MHTWEAGAQTCKGWMMCQCYTWIIQLVVLGNQKEKPQIFSYSQKLWLTWSLQWNCQEPDGLGRQSLADSVCSPGKNVLKTWFSRISNKHLKDISFKSAQTFWNISDSVIFELASFSQEIRDCSGLYGCVCVSRGKCMCILHEELNTNTVLFSFKHDVCCKFSVRFVSTQNNSTKCSCLLIFWSEKWQKRSQSKQQVITNTPCLKKTTKNVLWYLLFPIIFGYISRFWWALWCARSQRYFYEQSVILHAVRTLPQLTTYFRRR